MIDVPLVNPLVANFAFVACPFVASGPTCGVGSGLNFADHSTGAQTWDYDWDCRQNGSGCGSFENPGNSSPVTSHTYSSAGTYTPQLRVNRGVGAARLPALGDQRRRERSAAAAPASAAAERRLLRRRRLPDRRARPARRTAASPRPRSTSPDPRPARPTPTTPSTLRRRAARRSANGWTWSHDGTGRLDHELDLHHLEHDRHQVDQRDQQRLLRCQRQSQHHDRRRVCARRRLHHPGERPHGELQRHARRRGRRPRIRGTSATARPAPA